ncbi:P-loop containing nucleoside triphosphate hydrolase protein [Chlamydoabsidia padenii]|nr:P-loop containing nucleoside triphosphate hydrolase protein [Chlamydoabsidia padenii]
MSHTEIPVSPPSTPLLYSSNSLTPSPSSSYASLTSYTCTMNPRPRPSKSTSSTGENIQVMVRCRPSSDMETKADEPVCWMVLPEEGLIKLNEPTGPAFEYDKVFKGINNTEIYQAGIQNLVRSSMEGYNGTVFAYGQTASGKTYTMTGTKQEPGVIPKAIQDVFAYIEEEALDREYLLQMSYMEIYNEKINDLLDSKQHSSGLKIRTANEKDYVENLTTVNVSTPKEVLNYIKMGDARRHTSETDYNGKSSRSHTIFQLIIESKSRSSPIDPVQTSRLNLIDLAGSEKVASNSDRRQESSFINKSLLTLGKVIIQLNDRSKHIPYRDSKLTRILSTSLSGNDRVAVICTINPTWKSKDESTNTLRFAQSVKKVRINPKITMVTPNSCLQNYKEQIAAIEIQMQKKTEQEAGIKERLSQLLGLILTYSNTFATETTQLDGGSGGGRMMDSTIDDIIKECEDNLSATIQKYQADIMKKEQDLQQFTDRLTQSQQNLEENTILVEELQRFNEELQSQLEKYRNSFAEVNKRWNGLESSIKDYKERLIISEGKVTILEAQRQADDHTKAHLKQQVEDYKAELEQRQQDDKLIDMVQSLRDDGDDDDTSCIATERLQIGGYNVDKEGELQQLVNDLEKQLFDTKMESAQQKEAHNKEMEKEREHSNIYRKKIEQVQTKLYEVEAALKQAKLDEVEHALKQTKHVEHAIESSTIPPALSVTTLPSLTSQPDTTQTAPLVTSSTHPIIRYLHLGQGAWVLLLAFGFWLFL